MRKRVILICIFVTIGLVSKANFINQDILDSLKHQLINETDKMVQADTYYNIAELFGENNFDSTLYYSKKYLETSIKTLDSFWIADAYYRIANLYYYYNYDSTLYYSQKYLETSINTLDSTWIADAYNLLAYSHNQKGNLIASLENYQKALDCFIHINDSSQIAASYINIGYTITFGPEQAKALQCFFKGLSIAEDIKDTSLMSDAYYNIAYYYDRIKDYETSVDFYQTSLRLSLNSCCPDSNGNALTNANLAYLNIKLNKPEEFESFMKTSKSLISNKQTNYEKADLYSLYLDNYIEAQNIDSAQHYLDLLEPILIENSFDIIEAYTLKHKGRLSFLKKNYEESIKYLNKSIKLFEKNNSVESFSETYTLLANANAALNRYRQAYLWQNKANSFKDILKLDAIKGMLTEFEQTKIHEIELQRNMLKMELDQQKILNTNMQIRSKLRISIAALILLSIFILISIFIYKTIRKNNLILFNQNELIQKQKLLLEKHVLKLEDNETKLQELNATKDKFFSIIAHDLRNPFHSIINLSELFMNDYELMKSSDMTRILVNMNKTANYGFSLLENLLEWSKSQTGNIIPKPEEIEMDNTMQDIIADFKPMLVNKHIAIKFEGEKSPPVLADKNMITTVIRNLLHNAIKFSYENSTISIRTHQKNSKLVTTIKDEGIGISEQDLLKLFLIDSQVRKVGTNKERGTGLGLILCKEFITKNNGDITAEGQKDKGCTFSFTLPMNI